MREWLPANNYSNFTPWIQRTFWLWIVDSTNSSKRHLKTTSIDQHSCYHRPGRASIGCPVGCLVVRQNHILEQSWNKLMRQGIIQTTNHGTHLQTNSPHGPLSDPLMNIGTSVDMNDSNFGKRSIPRQFHDGTINVGVHENHASRFLPSSFEMTME